MRWDSELGLVVGVVLFVLAVVVIVATAGDPKACTDALCGGAR